MIKTHSLEEVMHNLHDDGVELFNGLMQNFAFFTKCGKGAAEQDTERKEAFGKERLSMGMKKSSPVFCNKTIILKKA